MLSVRAKAAAVSVATAGLIGTFLSMPAPQAQAQSQQTIKVDGSSTVFPITEAMAEEFQKNKKVKVTVGVSGTGGGFKKFCRGETDISNASRPILKKEMDACKEAGIQYIELPVAYDALTVMVNPSNTWASTMTVAELKKVWEPDAQGKITNWNQVRPSFPNAPLKLYGPGADSGTFDYFTEAVVGKSKASRGDFTASEDDNVLVQGVANDKNALGYFGYAYYAENKNKLKAVGVDGGKGPVLPSDKTVEDGTYNPLSRPIFIYVSNKAMARPEVKEFVEFYLKSAPTLVKQVKYVPLPKKAYDVALSHFQKNRVGTVFGGEAEVGLKIEDLLSREAKF
ncbi:PstS family phosphate ABC transporter substrate-binding protein [Gloeobacter morelensis]|uniref:Phosphate-binding protein n=1 Tax=Gloeobacter morelensis MG652769 TaxID=2781736 RepID=A0ABY3PTJ4_9CYAN|nr:PstS family phosphate ABC transporter substrate-binding protein [Gloeobacter morelensis]UFP96832.1 PstS family phosphate ABC transporter substrate-binding protein [Gloeobacter morelensis MG652769]